ncbi:MAG: SOS response-associated peptidase [Myxococcota bacterium]
MCGRMTLTRSPQEIAAWLALADPAALQGPDGRALRPRFNIAPSQPVLTVVADARGDREPAWKRWGLVPGWARDPAIGHKLFNARGETVDEKPSFRSAFRRRRCLVVADGFYEWTARNRGHRAHWLHPRSGPLLAFAGLYEHWSSERDDPIESCTVITTEANPDVAPVHDRMPVVLPGESWPIWLGARSEPAALKALLAPAPVGTLAARPVSRHVNDPRHDDPACLEAPPLLEPPDA